MLGLGRPLSPPVPPAPRRRSPPDAHHRRQPSLASAAAAAERTQKSETEAEDSAGGLGRHQQTRRSTPSSSSCSLDGKNNLHYAALFSSLIHPVALPGFRNRGHIDIFGEKISSGFFCTSMNSLRSSDRIPLFITILCKCHDRCQPEYRGHGSCAPAPPPSGYADSAEVISNSR